jgi:class 3 adenylate cyclase
MAVSNTEQILKKEIRGRGIGHEIYPMRILGYIVLCAELWLKMLDDTPTSQGIYRIWIIFFFFYPHIIFRIYHHFYSRNSIERTWLILDLFWIGLVVVMIDFSLMPTMALIVYSTATCIGIGGLRMWAKGILAFGIAQALMWVFWDGFEFTTKPDFWSNLIGFVYMFTGFNAYNFAYYRRSITFKKIRMEIERQKVEIADQKEEIQATLALVEVERHKSDALLLNILPTETAKELKETGQAKPTYYDLVTVLFTDFKGFTHIAEKLSPQQVIEELNICFLAFDEICDRHNLEKIKTIGDSYMCAGGIPTANTTNPVDAVNAAFEMQDWMKGWTQAKIDKGEDVWEIRLGIHSGGVVAGVIGKNKFAYDIWGDTVNTASRLESSGEAGKINISGATYLLVQDKFNCTYRGKVKAKNKGEVDMYFVESQK